MHACLPKQNQCFNVFDARPKCNIYLNVVGSWDRRVKHGGVLNTYRQEVMKKNTLRYFVTSFKPNKLKLKGSGISSCQKDTRIDRSPCILIYCIDFTQESNRLTFFRNDLQNTLFFMTLCQHQVIGGREGNWQLLRVRLLFISYILCISY